MSLRINQNIASLNAYRNLSVSDGAMAKSLEKLSSGLRINRAADDAAGLVKSEGLRSGVRGAQGAVKNAQDGVSLVQTAEGALDEVSAILQRMRELAVDAQNTATTDGAAQKLETDELIKEINDIGAQTKFNGTAIFSASGVTFQVGGNNGETLSVTVGALTSATVGGANNLSTWDPKASGALTTIDAAIKGIANQRATLGAAQNRLEHRINSLNVAVENLSASESRIRDTDMAAEMAQFTRSQILTQAGTAMLAQANAAPQSVLQLLRG
jgi:flagellin